MSVAGELTAAGPEALEKEYLAHRRGVMAMLGAHFGGLPDHEELYQEAWTEALEIQARGETIGDFGQLLRSIVWKRACDALRKHKPATLNPHGRFLRQMRAPGALPEDVVEKEILAASIWHVVETLEPRQAAVIKLRFDRGLSSREMQRELGVSPKRLEKIVTAAYARVEEALAADDGQDSEWRRRQRSLLVACEAGLASARQRRHASRMVQEDPTCRAMLAQIRSALEQIAAVVPVPLIAAAPEGSRFSQFRIGLLDRFASARDSLADVMGRLMGQGSGVEQATAGGAISLTGTAAAKLVLTCFAVAGTTVVCLTGPLAGPVAERPKVHKPKPTKPVKHEPTRADPPDQIVHHIPIPPKKPAPPKPPVTNHRDKPEQTAPVSASPPPSPAPPASTEFGPGTTGSTSAPRTPAAAPTSGGGEFTP